MQTAAASRAARKPSLPCASPEAKASRLWSSSTARSRRGCGPQNRPDMSAALRAASAAQMGQ
eukprot:10169508-Lingulodinium_polyedra.AAC.1